MQNKNYDIRSGAKDGKKRWERDNRELWRWWYIQCIDCSDGYICMPKLSHYTPYIGTVNCILVDANRSIKRASQVALVVNNLPANAGDTRDMGLIPGSGRSAGGGNDNPGESHGQRSLVGFSPWGWKESDTTECLST